MWKYETTNCYFVFRIRHYAGTLNYSITNFVQKNADKIPKHLSSGLYQSKLSIVQNLFPEGIGYFSELSKRQNIQLFFSRKS